MASLLPRNTLAYAILLFIIIGGCEQPLTPEDPIEPLLTIPDQGASPLPFVEGTEFIAGPLGARPNAKANRQPATTQSAPKAHWKQITPLLEAAAEQSDSRHVALFSIRDSSGTYGYRVHPLAFSEEILASSDGAGQPVLFTVADQQGIPRVALARIPDTPAALDAFTRWLRPRQQVRQSKKATTTFPEGSLGGRQVIQACRYETFSYSTCAGSFCGQWNQDIRMVCDGGGGGSGSTWDWGEPQNGLLTIEAPGRSHTSSNDQEDSTMEIIKDSSFKNTKAECVFNELNTTSTGFAEAIQKFDGEFPVSHLKFKMEDLGSTIAGRAIPPNSFPDSPNSPDYVITIVLNNNPISKSGVNYRPNLLVAKTLAHEVIHAEMFRKLMSLTNQPNFDLVTRQELKNLLSNGDYPGIYDYYRRHKNWQHQQMATHYREAIADMLQEYDGYGHNRQFYMDVAWEGLMFSNIPTWSNKSNTEKNNIKNVILRYISNNKNEECQK